MANAPGDATSVDPCERQCRFSILWLSQSGRHSYDLNMNISRDCPCSNMVQDYDAEELGFLQPDCILDDSPYK